MAFTLIRRFLVGAAILALASFNAFASNLGDCAGIPIVSDDVVIGYIPYTLDQFIGTNAGNYCEVNGDKLFQNFAFNVYTSPDYSGTTIQASDISISDFSSGSDVGLTFTPTFDGSNQVTSDQGTMNFDIEYMVSPILPSTNITEVYSDVYGYTNADGVTTAEKDLCPNFAFSGFNSDASGICISKIDGTVLTPNPDNGGLVIATYDSISVPLLGVSDYVQLYGGTGTGSYAEIDALDNAFGETAEGGVPEPATFLLLGSALMGIGVLRRKRP
jgi:hypothetical protein